MNDTLGAFCRANPATLQGAATGALAGKTFAAKDVFDIAGTTTGFGQPDWLRTHAPATATASAVQKLLDAGASLAGRTLSDEMCYSLSGENVHYGTPLNPRAPDRIPGGSSNGSASAVAGGLADVALGTDCGGSVRIPASYCGLFGIRTSHGRVADDGVIPFAPTFDVVGWFARNGADLASLGNVLLPPGGDAAPPRRLLMAPSLLHRAEPGVRDAVTQGLQRLAARFGGIDVLNFAFDDLDSWRVTFQTVQASEIWANHGAWITATQPSFGPGIKERLAAASTITAGAAAAARTRLNQLRAEIRDLIQPGDVLCLPTAPRIAPLRGSPTDDVEIAYRNQAMSMLCIAGIGGLPQINIPLPTGAAPPIGLSLAGGYGADESLLALAASL